MYVLDVIALSPTSPAAPLSYRSKENYKPGTIVSIMLRNTPTRGIVVNVTEVKDAKALLKSAPFMLAKSVRFADGMLPKVLLDAAAEIASYHAVPLGSVLHALLSDPMATDIPRVLPEGEGYEERSVEFPRSVRYRKYRSIIEDNKKATLLVVPTIAELNQLKEFFAGVNPIVLSGDVKPDARRELLNEAAESSGLVLTTPAFSFVVLKKLGHIIIERPSAGTYRMLQRPYLNRVEALRMLAQMRSVPVSFGDYPLPLERRDRKAEPVQTSPSGTVEVMDMRGVRAQGEAWQALPEETLSRIKAVLKDNGRVLIFAARKGYAPSVVCRDCGTTLRDEQGRSYALATVGGERVFRTADGIVRAADKTTCDTCGSWNLLPLGVGPERVEEELKASFPDAALHSFNADAVKTDAAARRTLAAYKKKRGILVATEVALPWLSEDSNIDLCVIASMDSLLSLPFWRSRERFVRIGFLLRELASHTIVQTRNVKDSALDAVAHPKETSFFAEELQLRKALMYPPFGTLIAFHVEGSKKRLLEAKIVLTRAVLPYTLSLLPERIVKAQTYRLTAVLHIPNGKWPDKELSERIQALPPYVKVELDPESFW